MSLNEYDKKRDFSKTPEPKGEKRSSKKDLIFVVQKHAASRLHYDFRLEWDGVLLSWAVPKGPSYNPADKRLAVEVEPHPYDYREFEGIIPAGEYGGGTVMIWDEGTWEPQPEYDFAKGLTDGSIKIILHGTRLKGKWALVRMKPRTKEEDKNWLLIKERDDEAMSSVGIDRYSTSVKTGKTMEQIAAGNEEESYEVQLATLREKPPAGEHWIHELKYDGYRMVADVNHEKVRLYTRNHQDYTDKFPAIVKELASWDTRAVMDGEIIVAVDGRSNFQALQNHLKTKQGPAPSYLAFDMLFDQTDIRDQPLRERRKRLEQLLGKQPRKLVQFSRAFEGDAEEVFEQICQANMEGIISKRSDRPYIAGRGDDWLKIKCRRQEGLYILGFTQTDKRTRAISALLLGVERDGVVKYAGRVGTGFDDASAKELHGKLKSRIRKTAPIADPPSERTGESITWVRPDLIARVNFTEWTNEGLVRQASYLGLDDAPTSQPISSKPVRKRTGKSVPMKAVNEVMLTSPDKLMFEAYTKQDLANYYEKMAERMLPYVKQRLMSLVRCPDGIAKDCFYQKHLREDLPGLETMEITESDGDQADYIYLFDALGLQQAIQNGTIEFHIWGSRIDRLEQPDMIVFDLDPDESLGLKEVRQGVRDLKSILDQLGLEAFLKTSGGKGYHIVVPLTPSASWDEVREFSKNLALAMEQKWPDRYTANMRKEKRQGKIYIDWVRNGRGATSVAPYSVRARPGAPVSWPIAWSDLSKVSPADMTIDKALKSRKKDAWADYFDVKQGLK